MNDRPRDDDEQSASDWLAAQFGAQSGQQPPAPRVPTADAVTPPASVPPASVPPASVPPATPPQASTPPAPAASGSGFTWGLRPGASAAPVTAFGAGTTPPAAPVTPPAAAPQAPGPAATVPPPVSAATSPSAGAPVPPPAALVTPSSAPVTPPQAPVTPPQAPGTPAPVVPPPASAAPAPPASAAPVPPPLVEPPSSADTPTVAWTPPAPTAPPATAAPTPSWDQPTQMMDAVPAPAPATPAGPQASIPPAAAADLSATEMIGSAAIANDASTTSALEALFGEENFRDYSDEPTVPPVSFGRRSEEPAVAEEPTAAPAKGEISRTQKILLGVAGGLVALLALFALFLLGTRLPVLTGADAAPTPTPTPTAVETVPPLTDGPVEPGVWAWNELLGGECLDPYDGPWEVEYTVVDCADAHPAQLAYRGELPPAIEGELEEPFPGAEALLAQVQGLCSGAGVLDLAAAGQYTDMQVEVAYPVDAEQWNAGERHYFCFVSRSSGEPLAGSVAIAPASPSEG